MGFFPLSPYRQTLAVRLISVASWAIGRNCKMGLIRILNSRFVCGDNFSPPAILEISSPFLGETTLPSALSDAMVGWMGKRNLIFIDGRLGMYWPLPGTTQAPALGDIARALPLQLEAIIRMVLCHIGAAQIERKCRTDAGLVVKLDIHFQT